MNNDWTVGTRVFCITSDHGRPEKGHIITLDGETKARVRRGKDEWTRDGRPYGGQKSRPHIRSLRDGDNALDAAWRASVMAENNRRAHEARAWTLTGVHGQTWSKLSPDKIEQIHAWLAEVKS